MAKERLTDPSMTMMDVVIKMAEGIPGTITILMKLMKEAGSIDPRGAMGGLGPILTLDSLNIYGSDIWNLWKYVCGGDMVKMVAVLRAWQMGQLAGMNEHAIHEAIRKQEELNLDSVLAAVRKELPDFSPLPS